MSIHIPHEPVDPEGRVVPADSLGFAISDGDLRIGDDFFELDFSDSEAPIVQDAVREHDDTPSVFAQGVGVGRRSYGWKGSTLRGDYPMIEQIVDAVKWYENFEAGLGEDKLAYDARTALNHALPAVRKALHEDTEEWPWGGGE